MIKAPLSPRPLSSRRRGFTLIQLVLAIAIISALSAIAMGVFSRSRSAASRAQCDTRIKAIIMALDAFRQENGKYPVNLSELLGKKYLTDTQLLRCPNDPRESGGYNDFYIQRSNRDSDELPILVCPLCVNESEQGIQSFKGRYTKQFATRPAQITAASGALIERPGKTSIAARAGMLVRGGDSIRTDTGGQAVLSFADGSTSTVKSDSEITVLQSFIAGHSHAPLYTLIRQKAGDVLYKVHHGSKFDVATPTATAGALGTEFQIRMDRSSDVWYLKVHDSKVYCSMDNQTELFTPSPSGANTISTVSNNSTGFGKPGGTTTVLQTNDWIPMGEIENVPSTTPNNNINPANNSGNGWKKRNYNAWRAWLRQFLNR